MEVLDKRNEKDIIFFDELEDGTCFEDNDKLYIKCKYAWGINAFNLKTNLFAYLTPSTKVKKLNAKALIIK